MYPGFVVLATHLLRWQEGQLLGKPEHRGLNLRRFQAVGNRDRSERIVLMSKRISVSVRPSYASDSRKAVEDVASIRHLYSTNGY